MRAGFFKARLAVSGAAAVMVLAGIAPAAAQAVSLIGNYNAWSAYTASDSSGRLCFALSKPSSVTPTPDGYTQAYLYLTHRPSENINNEINVISGFAFAPDAPATASVGGRDFPLFTQNDSAWLLDAGQSGNLAGAMRAGQTLTVTGTTDQGVSVTATFSLSGATAASRAIADTCAG